MRKMLVTMMMAVIVMCGIHMMMRKASAERMMMVQSTIFALPHAVCFLLRIGSGVVFIVFVPLVIVV